MFDIGVLEPNVPSQLGGSRAALTQASERDVHFGHAADDQPYASGNF